MEQPKTIPYPNYLEKAIAIDREHVNTMSLAQAHLLQFAEKLSSLFCNESTLGLSELKTFSVSSESVNPNHQNYRFDTTSPIILSYEALTSEHPAFDTEPLTKLSDEDIIRAAKGVFTFGKSSHLVWELIRDPHLIIPDIIHAHRSKTKRSGYFYDDMSDDRDNGEDDIYNV